MAPTFDGESHSIAIKKTEIIPTREHPDAQVRIGGRSVFRTGVKKIDGLRKSRGEYGPVLQPYPYVTRVGIRPKGEARKSHVGQKSQTIKYMRYEQRFPGEMIVRKF